MRRVLVATLVMSFIIAGLVFSACSSSGGGSAKQYQSINYTMPAGSAAGSVVSYTKVLTAGDRVDGSVQLTGQYHSTDWSYQWNFQVLGPGSESIEDWNGHWANNNYHTFTFVASYGGSYTIRVSHASLYPKSLVIQISPPGWGYSGA